MAEYAATMKRSGSSAIEQLYLWKKNPNTGGFAPFGWKNMNEVALLILQGDKVTRAVESERSITPVAKVEVVLRTEADAKPGNNLETLPEG